MCGRDTGHYTWAEVAAFSQPFSLMLPTEDPTPTFNRAPTQDAWVLVEDEGSIAARQLRWGLIPGWARDTKSSYATFNARIETIADKPTFKAAWHKRRCLIPSSGYFEWMKSGNSKQPYYIKPANASILMFAGIWECNAALGIDSYSIVTRPALDAIAHLHDRSPVMLPASLMRDWVDGTVAEALDIARADHQIALDWYAVGAAVGNVRIDDASLIARIVCT